MSARSPGRCSISRVRLRWSSAVRKRPHNRRSDAALRGRGRGHGSARLVPCSELRRKPLSVNAGMPSTEKIARADKDLMPQLKQWLRPLEPYLPKIPPILSWRHSFKVLERYRFSPATVFDIGVGFGTYELYRAYPHAFYYLVDPTPESVPHMRRIGR